MSHHTGNLAHQTAGPLSRSWPKWNIVNVATGLGFGVVGNGEMERD